MRFHASLTHPSFTIPLNQATFSYVGLAHAQDFDALGITHSFDCSSEMSNLTIHGD
jgi:hypothetical protein